MSRRFFFLLIIVILVGVGTTVFAAGYPDVGGTVYETAFDYLSSKRIIKGYADGMGRPHGYLNRAEALKVIMESRETFASRIDFYERRPPPLPLFSDIRQGEWYVPYLETAFENSIVRGYPDGTFKPARNLTVEEAVSLLMRAYGENGAVAFEQSPYIENRAGEWYAPSISRAIKRNLVMHSGSMRLGVPITRGQFFDMVYRMMMIEEEGAVAYDGPEPRQSVQATTNAGTSTQNRGNGTGTPARTVVHTTNGTTVNPVGPTIPQVNGHPHASEKFFAISMPSLEIDDLEIIHPVDPFSSEGVLAPLKDGVGHLFTYPGGGGKIMIYGHSSSFAWDVSPYTRIFRKVNELNPGDRVYVTYSGKLYTYEVTHEQTVSASDTTPFNDNGNGEELILYTCWPPDSISQRYLVHAKPVETLALR